MKKPSLALFIIFMSLLIIAPKLWAQGLVCEEVNGLMWCINELSCGQACNEVCATGGLQPADNTVWLEAQDTVGECQAISDAFGLFDAVNFDTLFTSACITDNDGPHAGGILIPPLMCTSNPDCPENHRTDMDELGLTCDNSSSRRSVCPCVTAPPPPLPPGIPTLSQWGLIAMAGVLGLVGFMVMRRRKAAA